MEIQLGMLESDRDKGFFFEAFQVEDFVLLVGSFVLVLLFAPLFVGESVVIFHEHIFALVRS